MPPRSVPRAGKGCMPDDVLVRGGAPGTAVLRTLPYDLGFGVITPEIEIATLACGGPAAAAREPTIAPLLQPFQDTPGQYPINGRKAAES